MFSLLPSSLTSFSLWESFFSSALVCPEPVLLRLRKSHHVPSFLDCRCTGHLVWSLGETAAPRFHPLFSGHAVEIGFSSPAFSLFSREKCGLSWTFFHRPIPHALRYPKAPLYRLRKLLLSCGRGFDIFHYFPFWLFELDKKPPSSPLMARIHKEIFLSSSNLFSPCGPMIAQLSNSDPILPSTFSMSVWVKPANPLFFFWFLFR